MKKRILLIAFSNFPQDTYLSDTEQFAKRFSGNLGNLAFSHAARNTIDGSFESLEEVFPNGSLPSGLDKDYDAVVFPAANNLNKTEDLGWLADFCQKLTKPICIYGLGAQASLDGTYPQLKEGSLRLLDHLRRNEIPLLVRGRFTKDFLLSHGLRHVKAFGCTSNLLNPSPTLGKDVQRRYATVKNHLSAGGKLSLALNLEYFGLESKKIQMFVRLMKTHWGSLVLQSDSKMFDAGRSRPSELMAAEGMEWIYKYFTGSPEPDDFLDLIQKHSRMFVNVPSWLEHLRTCDLSIGSRFHGNILALQAGTPAHVFVHDSRTKELCDSCKIPYTNWDEVNDENEIINTALESSFDGEAYDINRQVMAQQFETFLSHFSLSPSPALRKLAKANSC